MPLALVTREPADAAPYQRALEALGLTTLAMPLTAIEPAPPAALDAALASLGPNDRVALASTRAAELVAAALARVPSARAARYWAVGAASAAPLRACGLHVHVASTSSAVGLAEAISAQGELGRVVLPRAEEGRPEAALALRAAGYVVDEVVAYRSVARAAADPALAAALAQWRVGAVAVVALFAPSQVRALLGLVGAGAPPALPPSLGASPVLYVAIGQTTAAALAEAGVAHPLVCARPTPEAMANAVATRYPRSP